MTDRNILATLRNRVAALEAQVDYERNRLATGEIGDVMEYRRVHDAFQRAFCELFDAESTGLVPQRFG